MIMAGKRVKEQRKQELFSRLTYGKDGLYAYKLEHQSNGGMKAGRNCADILAVRYSEGVPQALVLIRVKSTRRSCKDKVGLRDYPGIQTHINRMKEYIESEYIGFREKEARDIIETYNSLGIRKTPVAVPEPGRLGKTEMVMIFTDEAIAYYKEHKKSIDKKGCVMLEWSAMDGLRFL